MKNAGQCSFRKTTPSTAATTKVYESSRRYAVPVIKHNPEKMYPQYQSYSHAVEVGAGSRLLIISGLNGYLPDGKTMPETFEEQGEIIWKYLGTILESAQMGYQN